MGKEYRTSPSWSGLDRNVLREPATEERDDLKRRHISMMNDMERQKLLEKIKREEEARHLQTEERSHAKKKGHMGSIHSILRKLKRRVEEKPAIQSEAPAELGTAEHPPDGKQQDIGKDTPVRTLEESIGLIKNDKYVFFCIGPASRECLPDYEGTSAAEAEKHIKECAEAVWGDNVYLYEPGLLCVLLRDCRLNRNALKQQGDSFLFRLGECCISGTADACYGFAIGKPGVPAGIILKEAVKEYRNNRASINGKHIVHTKPNPLGSNVMVEQAIQSIQMHNTPEDPLYLVLLASVDMDTLVIVEDASCFEELCRKLDIYMIACSYIYAINKSGGHWYRNSNTAVEIEEIFSAFNRVISECGGVFRKEMLYEIPNISLFKDIYLQGI